MLTTLAALLLGACTADYMPPAELFRESLGRPDSHEISTCGGGEDEFGKKIEQWKCLIWSYDGKGLIMFSEERAIPKVHYHVTGCNDGAPRITKDEGITWLFVRCMDSKWKERPCKELGLGIAYTSDFAPMPDLRDELGNPNPDWLRWSVSQGQTCATQAEAQQAVKACVLPGKDGPEEPTRAPARLPAFGESAPEGAKL